MVSQTPVSKPTSPSSAVKERSLPVPPPPRQTDEPAHEARPARDSSERKRGGWGGLITLLILCAAGGAGWYYRAAWLPYVQSLLPHQTKAGGKPPARVTPVVTAVVQQRNMDLYLNGLGTVTALKTVTVRSRVEGELIKVAFEEGQMVKEGDLLAEVDPRPFEVQLEQAEGTLARDQAALKSAELNLARAKMLLPSRSATQQEVDDLTALVQQAEATLKTDQATISNVKLQLTYCKITAPFSGKIGLRLVDQGNMVRANDVTGIAVITQIQPIAVVFTIPQDDIYRVQQKMRGDTPLVVEAYDRDFKTRLASGKLLATDNQVDPATGTLRLKALFEYSDNSLFPNQFVNTRLLVETRQNAIIVPSAAVQRGPTFNFVYVVRPDETVEQRHIAIGPTEGAETAIESGLKKGEIVVTDGIDKLQPDAKVSTRDTAAKAGGKGEPGQAKKPAHKDGAAQGAHQKGAT